MNQKEAKLAYYQIMSRRKFLCGGVLFATSLVASACRFNNDDPDQSSWRSERGKDLGSETEKVINTIRDISMNPEKFGVNSQDFLEFRKMVDNTGLSYSLTYTGNRFVSSIREKSFEDAIILAIAGLDVEMSRRYNGEGRGGEKVNVCNKYALDFSRLLLGNDSIGDRYAKMNMGRYNIVSGEPMSIGKRDIERWQKSGLSDLVLRRDEYFPFLHSNNIDFWLGKYGGRYGWKKLRDISDFPPNSLGIYCTPNETVNKELRKNPEYQGHMGCIFMYQGRLSRTQATIHVVFEFVGDSFLGKIRNGDLVVYTHPYR